MTTPRRGPSPRTVLVLLVAAALAAFTAVLGHGVDGAPAPVD
ncbi:MAG: hypothetical protein QOC80_1364, partial [Frankiaceae bacterium]|nr:hypothetical protein [Frankiaceae bacterium]